MNGQHRRVKINETGIFVLNTNFFFEVMENGEPKTYDVEGTTVY